MVKAYVIKCTLPNGQVRYITHGMTRAVVATPYEAMTFENHETAVNWLPNCVSGAYEVVPIFYVSKTETDSQNGKDESKGGNVDSEAVEEDSAEKEG